jgi:hypothetical protein
VQVNQNLASAQSSRLIPNVDAHRRQDTLARLRIGRQPDGFEQVRVTVIEAVTV